jgi:phosphatidylserine synthase
VSAVQKPQPSSEAVHRNQRHILLVLGISALVWFAENALFPLEHFWPQQVLVTLATLGAALSFVYSWKGLGWHGLFWLITAWLLQLIAKAFAPLTFSDLTRTLVYLAVLLATIGFWCFIVWMWHRQKRATS